ncbi:MAG: hypothetical protein GX783_13670 [Clostridiales bacterium]|nr:hypothetical protein [Clostridiales bacterium]
MKPVKLQDIVDGMDMQTDESRVFLYKETGEIIYVSIEDLSLAEDSEEEDDFSEYSDWQQESIEEALDVIINWENYEELPDKFEINEYHLMEEFSGSIPDERISNSLYSAIQGRGAFRRFKDTTIRLGVEEDWYKFREQAFRDIAIEWCEYNGIKYID